MWMTQYINRKKHLNSKEIKCTEDTLPVLLVCDVGYISWFYDVLSFPIHHNSELSKYDIHTISYDTVTYIYVTLKVEEINI